jgi:hypothetical protein
MNEMRGAISLSIEIIKQLNIVQFSRYLTFRASGVFSNAIPRSCHGIESYDIERGVSSARQPHYSATQPLKI